MKRSMKRWNQFVALLLCIAWLPGSAQQGQKEFTVKDIYGVPSPFTGKSLRGVQWIAGGKKFSYLETDEATKTTNIWTYDLATGKRELLVNATKLVLKEGQEPFKIANYIWSPNEEDILFTGTLPARRLKSGGNIYLYNLKTGSFKQLTDTREEQMNIKFSPDGKRIGFVRANNLFVIDLATGEETQLTTDGAEHILNGHFDWVYEEEFGIIDGWQWSPDGKYIAYWQLDERRVPEFKISQWDSLHLSFIDMRYPKAGDPNSIAKVGVVSIDTKERRWMDIGPDDDIYIPRIQWTHGSNTLSIQRLDRLQHKLELLLADITTGKTRVILTDSDTCWIDVHDDLTFLKTTEHFLWSSERDGYRHLYLYDMNGRLIRQLTRGNWEIERLVAVDEKSKVVYFTSTEKSPIEQHIYRVKLDGSGLKRISTGDGMHSVHFAPDFSHYLDTFSNVITPPQVSLRRSDGTLVRMVEENKIEALKDYKMGQHEFLTFQTTDGVMLHAFMIKPPDFDASKKYPVLVSTYGGPGSQIVRNAWGGNTYLWHQMLAQKGYIIFGVDNRGTGARGKAFRNLIYRHLGKWEVNDQIEGAKYLASLPYVDKDRIGIWGWSYGGYMASLALLLGADYFKTAVAIAPVTHWRYYDTIYTERYMDLPKNNPRGYEESAPITHASKLKGRLLLVHGTADDNVHFQNTVNLVNELQKANKQFRVMFYPNRDHGIFGGNTRWHLFDMITDFIVENL